MILIGHLDGDEIQVEQWHGEVVGRCERIVNEVYEGN